ncbi:Thioesterase superfamily protein [compost metagenome]
MAKTMSLVGHAMGDDCAVVEMPFNEVFTNSRGDVSGGAITTVLDLSLAAAVRSHDPEGFSVSTVELSTHFLAPCTSPFKVHARCTRRGKRICFAQGEARDDEDRVVATASGVFVLVPRLG